MNKKILTICLLSVMLVNNVYADNIFGQIDEWADNMQSGIESVFAGLYHFIQQITIVAMYIWFFISFILFFAVVLFPITLPIKFERAYKNVRNFIRRFVNITEI